MANIHQIITLGIGTPSSIAHLLLLGLSPVAFPARVLFEALSKSEFTSEAIVTGTGESSAMVSAEFDDEDFE